MFSVWAEEKNLGERLKSVCILILLLAVVILQEGRVVRQEAVISQNGSGDRILSEAAGNPIDAFFAEAEAGGNGVGEDERLSNLYLDCWEKELGHAYGLVKGRGKSVSLGEAYRKEAVDAFWRFAEAEAWMEAYLGENSSSFKGSLPARKAMVKARLLRSQALRLYELLKEKLGEEGLWDGQYAFHQDEAITSLSECGIILNP